MTPLGGTAPQGFALLIDAPRTAMSDQAVLEQATDAVVSRYPQNRVTFFNAAAERL